MVGLLLTVLGCGSTDDGGLFGSDSSGGSAGQGAGGSAQGGVAGVGASGTVGGAAGTGGGGAVGGGGSTAGTGGQSQDCDLTGIWGTYFRVDTTWDATAVIRAGSGPIEVWLLSDRKQSGTTTTDKVKACGIRLPDLIGVTGEKYGARFLAPIFDNGSIPLMTLPVKFPQIATGAQFLSEPVALQIGVEFQNPLTDPWIATGPVNVVRDHDNDGRPGVTIESDQAPGYSNPPVGLGADQFVRHYDAITRTVATLNGNVKSCDRLEGNVTVADIGGEPALHSRLIGCKLQSGASCNVAQTAIVNNNRPMFRPASAGLMISKRMSDEAVCGNVRVALP